MKRVPTIELISDRDCPNVDAARMQLSRALEDLGLQLSWQEWCSDDPALPAHARQLGSPTILVNGRDIVDRDASSRGRCCRVYAGSDGSLSVVPPVAVIVEALRGLP